MKFEDVAAQLNMSEEDKAALVAVAAKYPLDTVVVPIAKFTETKSAYDRASKIVDDWNTWQEENWNSERNMTKAEITALAEADTLRQEVTALKAGAYVPGENNMTFEEVEAQLLAKGYVKKDDINGVVTAAKTELAGTLDGKINQHGVNQEFFFTRSATIPMKYAKEFGDADDFDMDAFMRFTIAGGEKYIKDSTGQLVKRFDASYDDFVASKRLQVERQKLDTEKAQVAQLKTELEEKKVAIPSATDNGTGGATIPAFQRRIQGMDKDDVHLAPDAPLGSGSISAQAWQMYQRGELPGVNKPN